MSGRMCQRGLHDLDAVRTPGRTRKGCHACEREYKRGRRQDPKVVAMRKRSATKRQAELKAEALDAYGGACACCGESERAFLQFDHVDGGGGRHRRVVHPGIAFYRWLKREGYPSSVQVLCANCNWAKGVLGACPHARMVSV